MKAVMLAAIAIAGVAAQTPRRPADERFEAASIKLSPPGPAFTRGTLLQGNRWRAQNASLMLLVQEAYRSPELVTDEQFVGGPDWTRTERYDISAVAPGTPTREQFNTMVRELLSDRFNLVVRRDRRELPVFALTQARGDGRLGSMLTRSNVDCTAYREAFARGAPTPSTAPRDPRTPPTCDTLSVSGGGVTRLAGKAVDVPALTRLLAPYLGAPVIARV